MMQTDSRFMSEALRLAARARGMTSPNPMVGAVLVKGGREISRGYHRGPGQPHAEVVAIQSASTSCQGATLYVNLEPCCHFGRTPPCVDLIISSKIGRVVVGTVDPNPLVAGKGIERLRDSGIEVEVGLLERRCRVLNEAYFKYITTHRPFVTLKLAETLDGKIATPSGDSKWITAQRARRFVHRLRAASDAVLVGKNTVLADDPLLTVRLGQNGRRKNPIRVVLDSRLACSPNATVFHGPGQAIVVTTQLAPEPKIRAFQQSGVEVIITRPAGGRVDLGSLLEQLGNREITSLLVEGGAEVAWGFVSQRLVDKVIFLIAPKLLGGRDSIPSVSGPGFANLADALPLRFDSVRRIGEDLVVFAYPTDSQGRQGVD